MPSSTPLSTVWSLCPSPEILSDLLVENVNSENAPGSYVRMSPGEPYPDQDKYPGFLFLTQKTVGHDMVQRYWNTPAYYNEDIWNWEADYVSDGADYPIYARKYKTRRDQYQVLPRGSTGTLTGVWLIRVLDGGSGYDPDNPPTVTITNGTGTGATAVAFVNPDTSIAWIRLTAEGTNYTGAVTVLIDPPVSGTPAAAEAQIQASSCVLIKQTTQNFPEDDPRYALFLIETRVYQTFPGPVLSKWDWEPRLLKYIKVDKQLVLKSTVPVDPNDIVLADNVTVEYQDLTAVYSAKITSTVPSDMLWENGGDDFTYEATVNHRWPDQITEDPIVFGAVVFGTDSYSSSYGWDVRVEEGYAGPCRAIVTERYTADPTDPTFIAALPVPTRIFPKAQTIYVREYGGIAGRAYTKVNTFPIPLTLHPALEVQINLKGSVNVDGPLNGTDPSIDGGEVEATVPTGFSCGDSILEVAEPQRTGIGKVWLFRMIEIFYPCP